MTETPSTPSQRRIWWLIFFLLSGLLLFRFGSLYVRGAVHNNDYKHIHAGSFILAAGGDPYDPEVMFRAQRQFGFNAINPYVYPPASGLLMRPFTMHGFSVASTAWFVFNLLLALLCVLAGPWWLRLEHPNAARLTGLAYLLFALPFVRQMTAGQMNVALLAMLVLTLGLLVRGWNILAGGALALAAGYKLAPLFLIVILVSMRRWRAGLTGLILFIALCVGADYWSGGGKTMSFLRQLPDMGYGHSTWHAMGNRYHKDPFNQSINALMFHLFEGGEPVQVVSANPAEGEPVKPRMEILQVTEPWIVLGPWGANALTWLCSLALLAWLVRRLREHRRFRPFPGAWGERDTRMFLMGFLLMLLLPSLMWDHYAVQTLLVVMILAGSGVFIRRPLRLTLFAAALLLLAWPVMHTHPDYRHGLGILVMSVRLWGVLLLLALVAVDRHNAADEAERSA